MAKKSDYGYEIGLFGKRLDRFSVFDNSRDGVRAKQLMKFDGRSHDLEDSITIMGVKLGVDFDRVRRRSKDIMDNRIFVFAWWFSFFMLYINSIAIWSNHVF